jgi:hypothetical protein
MREILRITRHHIHLRNATLMAPLGSLHLRLVGVYGKTEASGSRSNGNKTATTAAEVAATGGKRCGGQQRRRVAAVIHGRG